MTFPIFDLHCDTPLVLLGKNFDTIGDLRSNHGHFDLERAKKHNGYCQCFACYTSPDEKLPANLSVFGLFERELAAILQEVEKNSDVISLVYSADDIEENRRLGKMSALLTIEGPAGFDYNYDLLEDLYKIGFRLTTLSWNEQNPLTGSCVTGGGLTEQGREYVSNAQNVGMAVDVSHISDEAFWDIMDITEKPIIASHSNSRTLWNHPRNLTDEMYLAICKTGGTVGINLYPDFLGNNATVDTVCDHIFHFLNLSGDDQHVSLGSDFDGIERLPVGISGVEDYGKIAERLAERGLNQKSIENIYWNNALGVIRKCSM